MSSAKAKLLASGQTGFRPTYEEVDEASLTTTIQKRLIVCSDGTWFASDKGTKNLPSNVARIGRLIANEGEAMTNITGQTAKLVRVPQIVYYQSGVGTGDLTWVDKRIQGAFGQNLDENVCSAYNFLCNNYAPGDEIFLFGFSRGAYTARALAGLILSAGFIPPGSMTSFYDMYQAYKNKKKGTAFQESEWWKLNAEKLGIRHKHVNIKFLGVWDTVGALGLPDSTLSRVLNSNKGYQFHDTELSSRIQKAAHALALDEYRGTFSPTLWFHRGEAHMGAELIQCWFPGYHAHIGGGTVEDFLDESSIDDLTLAWMVDQTRDFLTYDKGEINRFVDSQKQKGAHRWGEGTLTDSASYAFLAPGAGGWKTRTPGEYKIPGDEILGSKQPSAFKPNPTMFTTNEYIHPSVRYRMGLMKSKPTNLGSVPGWVYGSTPIEKYEPAALKGFKPSIADDGWYNYMWKKPQGKKGEDAVEIREYKIPPSWEAVGVAPCEGLERQIVPPEVMKEFDQANNYGESSHLNTVSNATNTGFQPQNSGFNPDNAGF